MSDTPDFSAFNWSSSQQSNQADPVDPSIYSQHQSHSRQHSQRGDGYSSQRDSPVNGAGGASSSTARENSDYASFTFGQPTSSQTGSQSGYYNLNGGVDPSQTNYTTSDAGGYTPIDPALTAGPPRQGDSPFNQGQSSQQSQDQSSLYPHLPPSNFNAGRRYSTPALSTTSNVPYTIPRRANMYPPQYSQRSGDSSTSFAQPPPRSPAFSSPLRSFPQGGYANLDRRMSMPTNSLWQLAHQNTPQQQTSPVAPHTDPRPRQLSMVDWRLTSQAAQSRPSHSSTLLADLDASAGMLSLRQAQWGGPPQSDQLDFNPEMDERRGSYDPGLGAAGVYDTGRRGSMDSNATQPVSVMGDGMKKHACPICQKKFTRPSSLQTHMYSHTGEKPFKCEFEGCGRSFSVVSNLRRHKKIHLNSNGR